MIKTKNNIKYFFLASFYSSYLPNIFKQDQNLSITINAKYSATVQYQIKLNHTKISQPSPNPPQ